MIYNSAVLLKQISNPKGEIDNHCKFLNLDLEEI
jgi:hypothetical protein